MELQFYLMKAVKGSNGTKETGIEWNPGQKPPIGDAIDLSADTVRHFKAYELHVYRR